MYLYPDINPRARRALELALTGGHTLALAGPGSVALADRYARELEADGELTIMIQASDGPAAPLDGDFRPGVWCYLPELRAAELAGPPLEELARVWERAAAARERARPAYGQLAGELLGRAVARLELEPFERDTIRELAESAARLAGSNIILPEHMAEALAYRAPSRAALAELEAARVDRVHASDEYRAARPGRELEAAMNRVRIADSRLAAAIAAARQSDAELRAAGEEVCAASKALRELERSPRYQVVAVYPSGNRYPVRRPHDTFEQATIHRDACVRDADPRDEWIYVIDELEGNRS